MIHPPHRHGRLRFKSSLGLNGCVAPGCKVGRVTPCAQQFCRRETVRGVTNPASN